MPDPLHILFVAAENDALPGGKVGGVGDVVRDVPLALAAHPDFQGTVTVLSPSYGFLHQDPISSLGTIEFSFGGQSSIAELYEVAPKRAVANVRHVVIHHPDFKFIDPVSGRPRIYCDDPPNQPFATDANRFAKFCAALAEGLLHGKFRAINRLHLHDWHTGFFLILRQFEERYTLLRSIWTVFSIHNLALQGIRPLAVESSSLANWYPELKYNTDRIRDPEYHDCVNPMAVGIRFANRVHVVSPNYADEVCRPSLPKRNHPECVFFGGEGLEGDLLQARSEGRLVGILNGCEYPVEQSPVVRDEAGWQLLLDACISEVERWPNAFKNPRHLAALDRLRSWRQRARPAVVMTSVTRVVDQKTRLMRYPESPSPIERVLARSGDDAVYILAGSGDSQYEAFFAELATLYDNFVFLNGFSVKAADTLYEQGDLFLMPSAFEPCGISQMLAMRAGQPCVVHATGGLKDTVHDGETGFTFEGRTPQELGNRFVDRTLKAIRLKQFEPALFEAIGQRAAEQRFLWSDSVARYLSKLYAPE